MGSFTSEFLACLCMGTADQHDALEGQPPLEKKHRLQTADSLAADILSILYSADTNDERLAQRLQDAVHVTGWYEDLAGAVLTGLQNALEAKTPMGQAMRDAHEKATQVVWDILKFGKEHPIFCAVVALGILVMLAPWAIEAIGFGELGPIEGTLASLWQSRYAGLVPKGSWFSFFQRLGMIWTFVSSPAMRYSDSNYARVLV